MHNYTYIHTGEEKNVMPSLSQLKDREEESSSVSGEGPVNHQLFQGVSSRWPGWLNKEGEEQEPSDWEADKQSRARSYNSTRPRTEEKGTPPGCPLKHVS